MLSNLKFNFNKSEAMGVGILPPLLQTMKHNLKFKWTDSALKYLGTYNPPKLICTFKLLPALTQDSRLIGVMELRTAFMVWAMQSSQNEYFTKVSVLVPNLNDSDTFQLL